MQWELGWVPRALEIRVDKTWVARGGATEAGNVVWRVVLTIEGEHWVCSAGLVSLRMTSIMLPMTMRKSKTFQGSLK